MRSRARVLVLCLLCVARASTVLPSEEIAEFKARSATQDLSSISTQESNGTDERAADKLRDKRALGLLLSGLAQIFGYTVTPIQIATLPNPNATTPVAMSSAKSQVASSPMNVTPAPRQRETIRFTGVLNFGNNSNILGHLQRYEQIFHGPRNNMTMTTVRAPPKPMPSAQVTLDPRINSPTKPPLLAPFFVKIPLPIAPELLPATISEDLTLSYPSPAITIVSDSNAELPPIRKETVYKNNGNSERFTLEQKEIYDEKDVRKPVSKNTPQLFIDEPSGNKQQEAREERIKEQEEYRNPTHCTNDETKERYKDREEEIDNRNRQQASKYKSTEKKRPTHDDEEGEDSAERYEEREDEPKSSRGSSRQPPEKDDKNKVRDHPDDDGSDERDDPENLDKYVEAGYNRQLPIGDYFHEGNPEIIRDSYGEVLDDKRLEDDKLDEYINMFKHPNIGVYASQEVRNPDDASGEDGKDASSADGYDEHLTRLQKLREEYTSPENKYEEYDLNDERQGDRNDRSERNRAALRRRSKRPKSDNLSTKANGLKLSPVSDKSIPRNAAITNKAQQEIDFEQYTPLIIPVRYVDVNDKVQQATTQQLNYKEVNKSMDNQFSQKKIKPTVILKKELPLQTASEKTRHLHEGEFQKEFQLSPPFFDYAYDNTQPENIIIPPHLGNLENLQNYQHVVKNDVGRNANNDESSKEHSDYLVVVNNPAYRYPQNIYYYSNEVANPQNRASRLNAEGTHTQEQIYVPQQSNNQFIQTNPNLTEYNLNETTKNPYNYYYQPQEIPATVTDRYRYIFAKQHPQNEESLNFNVKNQMSNADNWSNRVYRPQVQNVQTFSDLPQTVTNYNVQTKPVEGSHNTQPREQLELQQKNTEKTEYPIQLITKNFNDPQTAHDFFGFSKNDYSFRDERNSGLKVTEENDRTIKEPEVLVAPEPIADHYDDKSITKYDDELENNPEKAKVKEYRNRVATLRVSEQRQTRPNGPIYYVDFIRNI